jgi:hypothetical protein
MGATTASAQTTVSGVVRDSLVMRPLVGAIVQLVDGAGTFNRTATSDSLGRYTLSDVPDGSYTVGFFHPMLDSLGLEPTLRQVAVRGKRAMREDLAIPSAARLREAICGVRRDGKARADSGALVLGFVRDARALEPIASATVSVEWLEYALTKSGMSRRVPKLVVKTAASGWFALCDVPSPGTVEMLAVNGADSTERVELEIPGSGFCRQDLYIGTASSPIARFAGVVTKSGGTTPLVGAEVKIGAKSVARTNERGEWFATDVAGGTRMAEVRAVGYAPERRAINIVNDAPTMTTRLSTLQAMLDTVRVRATKLTDRHQSGFEDRRRSSGMGRFITAQDIARRDPFAVSDLFKMQAGMRLERSGLGLTAILLRGTFADYCAPVFYIDGMYMAELTAEDVDTYLDPKKVMGIEIYPGSSAPAQFSRGMFGESCGSVVVWTK